MTTIHLPRNHHFNPVFYLSQWVGDDARVCEMRFVRGKMVHKRKHPQNTGRLKDLYRTRGVPEVNSQDLEVKFMTPLDTKAAAALWKILEGNTLDLNERVAWARFLLSLLYRNRECVEFVKRHMATLWQEATAALEDDWAAQRVPGEHQTLADATAARQPGAAERSAANILADIIGNSSALPDIVKMHWGKIDLRNSQIPLLTSDRPLQFVGLSDPNAYIALPIGPYDLFVAAFDDRFNRARVDATELAYRMNKDVVANGREFVWGADAEQVDFVRTWIGANPDRTILTKQQQDQGIAAARGCAPTVERMDD
ncbi:DUF4238 domain-containing protein [Bradyrhizobium sp. WYCCWR 13023]|uniref:DUF4238 domain-containing protein n=1 Tax=Bradyrhizobium zhengyangense TaxID=2911009 RepID=A0A9X1UAC0_9BRAD|nr:DUF4238 domain-containing protein [Bradyrhizobium zhengyangense]MCG2629716.1 DUF4238 domain-containing protein [Bradyrhizobium zhengyangense]